MDHHEITLPSSKHSPLPNYEGTSNCLLDWLEGKPTLQTLKVTIKPSPKIVALGLCFALLSACSTSAVNRHADSPNPIQAEQARSKKSIACCRMKPKTTLQRALAQTAVRFIGTSQLQAKGKHFRYDCSGLASAVYFSQGINLLDSTAQNPQDNGVRRIRSYVTQHGRLHKGPTTQPGDLVFFHNTYDANNDGQVNDGWTHVGIVEKVRGDGTVIFVSRVSRGIERYRMNLLSFTIHRVGKGKVLNDFLRRKRRNDRAATRYLTGELFAAFGTVTH